MKRIALFLFAVVLTGSGCRVFKGDQTPTQLKEVTYVNLFAWTFKPLSYLLPKSQMEVKGPTGTSTKLQLTIFRNAAGNETLVWLPMDLYEKLKGKLPLETLLETKKPGDKFDGFMVVAQALGNASIWTDKEMRKLGDTERAIAETYRAAPKYIVWDATAIPVKGIMNAEYDVLPESTGSKVVDSY
jgi:hypothetical protein